MISATKYRITNNFYRWRGKLYCRSISLGRIPAWHPSGRALCHRLQGRLRQSPGRRVMQLYLNLQIRVPALAAQPGCLRKGDTAQHVLSSWLQQHAPIAKGPGRIFVNPTVTHLTLDQCIIKSNASVTLKPGFDGLNVCTYTKRTE